MHHRCACVLWSLQHRLVRQKQIVHQWFVVWLYCRLKCTIYQHPQVPTSNYHGPPIPTSAHPYGHTTRPIHYCHRAVQYGRTTGPIHHCYLVADYNMCIVTETKKKWRNCRISCRLNVLAGGCICYCLREGWQTHWKVQNFGLTPLRRGLRPLHRIDLDS